MPSTQIWVALVTLALDLTAWMQLLLALTSTPARHWNPNVCGYAFRHCRAPYHPIPATPPPGQPLTLLRAHRHRAGQTDRTTRRGALTRRPAHPNDLSVLVENAGSSGLTWAIVTFDDRWSCLFVWSIGSLFRCCAGLPCSLGRRSGRTASSPLWRPRGLRYSDSSWSMNPLPETSPSIDHRHAAPDFETRPSRGWLRGSCWPWFRRYRRPGLRR
jgi:hypothetical protein